MIRLNSEDGLLVIPKLDKRILLEFYYALNINKFFSDKYDQFCIRKSKCIKTPWSVVNAKVDIYLKLSTTVYGLK